MRPRPGAVVLIAGAAAVGLWWRLGYALDSPLWRDEAQFLGITSLPRLSDVVAFLTHHESHPPLYYLLIRAWAGLAGWSDTAALTPSLVLGALVLACLFLVGRAGFGAPAGVLALVLGALSPTLILDAAMVRPYAFLSLLVLWSSLAVHRILQTGSRGASIAWVLLALAMVYTHNWAWLVVGAQCLLMLLDGKARWRPRLRRTGLHLAPVIAGYAPWLPVLLGQVRHAGYEQVGVNDLWTWLGRSLEVLAGSPMPLMVTVAALVVLAFWRSGARRRAGAPPLGVVCLAIPVFATLAALLLLPFANLLVSQCFAMLTPTLLAGVAIVLRPGEAGNGLAGAAAQVVTPAAMLVYWLGIGGMPKSNLREVAAVLESSVGRGDLVVLMPGYAAPAVKRYLGATVTVETFPDGGLPAAVQFDRRRQRNLDPSAADSLWRAVARVRQEEGRLWILRSNARAPELEAPMDALRTGFREAFGQSIAVRVQGRSRPLLEYFELEVYSPAEAGDR